MPPSKTAPPLLLFQGPAKSMNIDIMKSDSNSRSRTNPHPLRYPSLQIPSTWGGRSVLAGTGRSLRARWASRTRHSLRVGGGRAPGPVFGPWGRAHYSSCYPLIVIVFLAGSCNLLLAAIFTIATTCSQRRRESKTAMAGCDISELDKGEQDGEGLIDRQKGNLFDARPYTNSTPFTGVDAAATPEVAGTEENYGTCLYDTHKRLRTNNSEVLLVSSSRYPDRWIVPGGGLEPEEEPSAAAVREVYEEAGVKGTLGRHLGVFENFERKHRTFVYVLTVTEILEDWEDSVNIGRKRRWFSIEEAVRALQGYKPVQASYFQSLKQTCHPNNGAIPLPSQSALPDVR